MQNLEAGDPCETGSPLRQDQRQHECHASQYQPRVCHLVVSPSAMSLRIASDLEGKSAWMRRQASIASTSSGVIMTGTR